MKLTLKTINSLNLILKDTFVNVWELGGGTGFRYKHGLEVARFAVKIIEVEKLKIDKDIIYVAGLFHDIGKVNAINSNREIDYNSEGNLKHEDISIDFLSKYIGKYVDQEFIAKVVEIITEKDYSSSLERKVLSDADELGNFGFSQVWRTFNYCALSKQSFEQMLEFWKAGNLKDRKEWINKLNFDISKRVARSRFIRFEKFLQTIEEESLGLDIN